MRQRTEYYRVTGLEHDDPLVIMADGEGEMIAQLGRNRPISSWSTKEAFAELVLDRMHNSVKIDAAQYHKALETGAWDDGRPSHE